MKKLSIMKKIFIYLFLLIGVFTIALNASITAAGPTLDMIWTQAGEDASTELIVAWHGNTPKATLYWTLDSDENFSNAIEIEASGVYDRTAYEYEQITFYKFEVIMSDLMPNTSYRYRIKCGTTTSNARTCKTAGNAGNFNFLWIGDNHTYKVDSCHSRYTFVNSMVNALKKANKNFDFVVSSGDNVSYGGSYNNYQVENDKITMFKEIVFSSVPGNHDYYGNHDQYSTSVNVDNRFFEAIFAHPENGIGNPLDSSYWTIYNSIMFVMLDSLAASYSHTLADQKVWFEKVVAENEGKFQYLIVMQHYPWMNALTGAHSGPYGSNFNEWHNIFDKCGVDLALAGDHHVYYRSKAIYNGEILEGTDKGTVYVGCPQIGDRYRTITQRLDEEYYAIRIDDTADDPNRLADYSGCTIFTVTPDGIKGELIDTKGAVKDTYTVKAKRQVSWEAKKETLASTFVSSYNNTKAYIDFAPSYLEYIQKLRVYDGDNLIASVLPAKNDVSTIEIENLQKNKVYTYKILVDFVDGKSKTFNYTFNTYGDFGSFNSFKASMNQDNLVLSWNQDLKNDVVKEYKILQDGNTLATIPSTNNSYSIQASSTNISSKYTIQALAENKDIIFEETTVYRLFGDVNYDGSVNENEISALFSKIHASHEFKDNEITLLDLNLDGKVDIGDAILIYEYSKNEINTISPDQTFVVTVLDKDGNIDSIQKVKYGENATLKAISDANFLYYTNDGVYVTGDLVIRPVYK